MAQRKISLLDFVNGLPEVKNKVELVAAFTHIMEFDKKALFETEERYRQYWEDYKKGLLG